MSVRSSMEKVRTALATILARSAEPVRRAGHGISADQRTTVLGLLETGKLDEAVGAARDLVAWAARRRSNSAQAQRDARVLLLRCLLAGVSPKVEEAQAVAAELIESGDVSPDDADPALADAFAWLAEHSERKDDLEGASRLLEATVGIRERALGRADRQVTYTLENLSRVRAKQGRLQAALESRARAVSNREKIHGPDHAEVALGLAAMANLLWDLGHASAARACYRRAIDMVHEAPVEQIPAELRRELSEFPGLMREMWPSEGDEPLPGWRNLVN